tara:strand:- start:8527 stop:8769 length:243 start_codon:yes stop_codon:yes gene_type:complete
MPAKDHIIDPEGYSGRAMIGWDLYRTGRLENIGFAQGRIIFPIKKESCGIRNNRGGVRDVVRNVKYRSRKAMVATLVVKR